MGSLHLYQNQAVTFICGKNFKYAGHQYEVKDEFDQELAPGRIEQLVRTRHIDPVVEDRADKTRSFHREIHVREDIDRILGKARGKGQIVIEYHDPVEEADARHAPEPEPQDIGAHLKNVAIENALTEQVLEQENEEPVDLEEEETEPEALVHPAEHDEEALAEGYEEPEVIEEELYDPSEHNAPEVNEYLESGITQEEYNRVIAAERNGKARKGILGE